MSSSACWAIMGIMFTLQDGDVEAVEARQHPNVAQACRHGINTFLFTDPDGVRSATLIIGTRVAALGPENEGSASIPMQSLNERMSVVSGRLRLAGFTQDIQLYLIYDQDH